MTQVLWLVLRIVSFGLILIITGAFIPKSITDAITDMKIILFSFRFLKLYEIEFTKPILEYFDYEQADEDIKKIDIESGSILVNIYCLMLVFILMIFISLIRP